MTTLLRAVAGILLIAHGLVHLLFVVPDAADPSYPFSLERSWLLPDGVRRPVATVLMGAVVIAFLASALALWGVAGIAGAWSPVTVVAGSLSIVLLVAFWDTRLWIGVAISLGLIVLAVLQPVWLDPILP